MSVDFDDIDVATKTAANQAAADGSFAFNPAARKAEKIEVLCKHAISGLEFRVVVPKNARFKHVKQALANKRKSNDIVTRGQLMSKRGGIYNAFKDQARVGDVREVLVVCADLGETQFDAELTESDMSAEEEPTPISAEGAARASAAAALKPAVASVGAAAKAKAAAQEKPTPGVFTKSRAIALQKELLEGFKSDDFKEEMQDLVDENLDQLEFQKQRQQLFLTVQAEVLPKYGFEGTQVGVFKMMGQMGPFLKDPEFARLNEEINEAIGLSTPKDGWDTLAKSCTKLAKSLQNQDSDNKKTPKNAQAMPTPFLNTRSGTGAAGMPQARALGASAAAKSSPASASGVGKAPAKGPAAKAPAAKAPAGKAPPPAPAQGGVEQLQTLEGVSFEPFPGGKRAPYKLFVAGSWNDYKPKEMAWESEGGLFSTELTIGKSGSEMFQLLKNASWDTVYYPTIQEASPFEEHGVLGPDKKGHGLNWQIGKFAEDQAAPGTQFLIVAVLDKAARVMVVEWEKVG